MRLLKLEGRGNVSLTTDLITNIPSYAILSHTWGADEEEVIFDDFQTGSGKSKAGYAKIQFCEEQARKDGIHHIWIDTCCINKANNAELSEALNSMYRWYRDAVKCYVYLSDVSAHKRNTQSRRTWESAFRKSKWFTRGWTLQELLAPKSVIFFSREGKYLGDRKSLEGLIYEITSIPVAALRGDPLTDFSIDERLRWAEKRETKREEDKAYCLLGIFNIFMPPIYGEGQNALIRLKEEINKTRSKFDMNKVPYAKGAMFNAYDADHTSCHPATRVDLLRQIQDWAQQPQSKNIFWLNGGAGTGKSTISWTLAGWLADQGPHGVDLGASFFFKRGEGDRNSASRFFPTIVRQLLSKIEGYESLITEVISSDWSIFDKALGEQFDKLIFQPLQRLKAHGTQNLVVVVDALDECEKERDIKAIIELWSRLSGLGLRLFLTSRPDLPVRLGFRSIPAAAHHDMILQDEVPQTTIRQDIFVFLKDRFEEIRTQYNLEPLLGRSLEPNWPGDKILHYLVDMAVPLFIVAATVCRFVEDFNFNPGERLETFLQFPGIGEMEQMEQIYLPVLTQSRAAISARDIDKWYQDFRLIVGSIVTVAEPLPMYSLAFLLNVSPSAVAQHTRPLQSVLLVSADLYLPIRPLHLSFGEFLMSEKLRNEPFGIDGPAMHRLLVTKCLQLLSGSNGLQENMCHLEYPGQRRRDIRHDTVNLCLPKHIQYACVYWVHHLKHGQTCIRDDDEVHAFLRQHFLHWLEALSLLGKISDTIRFANSLKLLVEEESIQLPSFLHDAWRFILANKHMIDTAPLQLYSAALMFAPRKSIIRITFSQITSFIRTPPEVATEWNAELLKLEGHNGGFKVTFSTSGSLLAAACYNRTVRLWDPVTGEEMQVLEGHMETVNAVAFSSNDTLLASGSNDNTARVWNVATGEAIQQLTGHASGISGVAFSPDDALLATSSMDRTVGLWDIATGNMVQILKGHSGAVNAVSFSSVSPLLASASYDETVGLWNSVTGREVLTLEGHAGFVTDVVFSRTGSFLASASIDATVKLWNSVTGEQMHTFHGHTSLVTAVAFSPDDSLLASGSFDKTIRLWDLTTGEQVQKFEGHTSRVNSVAFSPVATILASAADDLTIRLWDRSQTGEAWRTDLKIRKGHVDAIKCLAFSLDGSLLASASRDATIAVWNTATRQQVHTLEGHTTQVMSVAFSSDGSLLASVSRDGGVLLWKLPLGEKVHSFRGHTERVEAIAFSSDNTILASGSWDRTIRLWNIATSDEPEVRILEGHEDHVCALAFSSDNLILASGSRDKTIRLWDLNEGKEMQILEGHSDEVKALAFFSYNSFLATASCDGVRLWNLATGDELGHCYRNENVSWLKFSEHDRRLDTDIGTVNLHVNEGSLEINETRGWHIRSNWMTYNNRAYLWLHPEYEPFSSARHGNLFALGARSGKVSFLELCTPEETEVVD